MSHRFPHRTGRLLTAGGFGPRGHTLRVAIGLSTEIPPGAMRGYEVRGRKIVVVNLDGKFHALHGICTHAYAEIAHGFFAGEYVTCPLHLSQFNARTGEAISPPATDALRNASR